MVEAGVPKEKFALMAVPLIPLQIVLPLAISKYTAGARPLDVYLKAMPYRFRINNRINYVNSLESRLSQSNAEAKVEFIIFLKFGSLRARDI